MKERNTTLDLAQGILIILVVLGHAIQYSGNGNWEDSQLGSAELISSHRQRVADVTPHSDEVDKKPP